MMDTNSNKSQSSNPGTCNQHQIGRLMGRNQWQDAEMSEGVGMTYRRVPRKVKLLIHISFLLRYYCMDTNLGS